MFLLDAKTSFFLPEPLTMPVRHAADMLFRDAEKVFGARPAVADQADGAAVVVGYAGESDPLPAGPEAFRISFTEGTAGGPPQMMITGSDDLGIVYALLHISRQYLRVDPFWFWADREPEQRSAVGIPMVEYLSPRPKVRFRGWFVNDEVCLIGWTDSYPPPREVWQPVFEALLRCGGNMVIPGTDLPRDGIHLELAWEMGLYTTHHHAEPLGAEMFFRAYPDREASFDKNGGLFEGLWREAIAKQKNKKVIWVLGFRGQGDCPFWEQDPSCKTPERRGELISRVIRRQYEILSEYVENPPCSTYLYGELTELYRQGFLNIPEGIIKIWADNGYGKMVSRRQGNDNPRVPSLPGSSDKGPHGLYYHITFHDLQASNHLTMFPSDPGLVRDELTAAFSAGAGRYLLLNSGNIKPHVYFLELVKDLWNSGRVDTERHLEEFCGRFFSSAAGKALECYRDYFKSTIVYGEHFDDRAGDEFYHHPARALIRHLMREEGEKTEDSLLWATGAIPFSGQVEWFRRLFLSAVEGWEKLREKCLEALESMKREEAVFFSNHLFLQTELHLSGCKGFIRLCEGIFAALAANHPLSFVRASQAIWAYGESIDAMTAAAVGRWKNFYRADWLTNVKSTIYSLDAMRKHMRMQGDSPDFFLWYKEYVMPESEKKIYLENTHRNPLSDDDLARRLMEMLPECREQ